MEKEWIFWNSNGRQFSQEEIANIFSSDEDTPPGAQLDAKWLQDKGYTWREKTDKDHSGFQFVDLTQEQFNNFADEEEAVKVLKDIYGDKFDFSIPGFWGGGVGQDYIKVKSHNTGRTHDLYLNTEFNQSSNWKQQSLADKNLPEEYNNLLDWMKLEDAKDGEGIAQKELEEKYNIDNAITLIPTPVEQEVVPMTKAEWMGEGEFKMPEKPVVKEPIQLSFEDTEMIISRAASIMDAILQNPQNFTDPKTGERLPLDNTGKIKRMQDYEPYHVEIGRILKNELNKVFFSGDKNNLQMYMGDDVISEELAAKFEGMEIDPEVLTKLVGVGSKVFKQGLDKIEENNTLQNAQTALGDLDLEIENYIPLAIKNSEDVFYNQKNQNQKNIIDLNKKKEELLNNIKQEQDNLNLIEEKYKEKEKDKDYTAKVEAIKRRIEGYKLDLSTTRSALAELPERLLDDEGEYVGADDVKREEEELRKTSAIATIVQEHGNTAISTAENIENLYKVYVTNRSLLQRDALNDYITLDLSRNFTEEGEYQGAGFMLREYRRKIIEYLNKNNIPITDPKNIKVSVYQAYDMGLFTTGDINVWDDPTENVRESTDPLGWTYGATENKYREATEAGEFSLRNIADWGNYTNIFDPEDIEKLKSYKTTMGHNQDILEVLYNMRWLQDRPKDIESGYLAPRGFLSSMADEFLRAGAVLFTGEEGDVLRDWSTGQLEGTDLLEKTNATLAEISLIAQEEGGIDALVFNEEDRAAFDKSTRENLGGLVGGFAPVLADLLVTGFLLESGVGSATGALRASTMAARWAPWIGRTIKWADDIYDSAKTGKGAWKTGQYMFMQGMKEEAKLFAAQTDFELGAGFAFGSFGGAVQKLGFTPEIIAGFPPAFRRIVAGSISGMTASEIALNLEAGIRDAMDIEDFANSWIKNYGDLSATTQRMAENAFLFGFYGDGAKSIYRRYGGTPTERAIGRLDFTWGKDKQIKAADAAIKEINENIKALGGELPGVEKAWGEVLDPAFTELQLANREKIQSLMDMKRAIQTWQISQFMPSDNLSMIDPYLRDKDGKLTKETNPEFDAEAKRVYDNYIRDLKNVLGKDFKVGDLIISNKKVYIDGQEVNAKYDPISGNITLSRQAMTTRGAAEILTHELFHKSVSRAIASDPVLFKKFEGKLDQLVDSYYPDLSKDIRNTYKDQFKDLEPEARELKLQEEILANFLQKISNPIEYSRLMDRGFFKELRDSFGDIIESVPGLAKNKYTNLDKIEPEQLLKTLARLAYQINTRQGTGRKTNLFKAVGEIEKGVMLEKELGSKELAETTLEIVRENKRIEDDIIREGLKDADGRIYASELMRAELVSNNLGILGRLADILSDAKRQTDLNIPKSEQLTSRDAWFNQLYIEAERLAKSWRAGEAPFGAYLQENLSRWRSINALETLKAGKKEGPRLEDTTLDRTLETTERTVEEAGTLELATALKMDPKLLAEFENNLYRDIGTAEKLIDLSYKNYRATVPPGFYNKIYGKTRAERKAFIEDNAKAIIDSWPETNQDPTGQSLGVGKGLLDLAYGARPGRAKMSKGATAAGLPIRVKEPLTAKELIEWAFGKDVNYTTSQARIKSIMELTTRGLATQLLSKAKAIEKMAVEFSRESEAVKQAEQRLQEVWDKEFQRVSEANVDFRISDINKAIEGVERAIKEYEKEVLGTVREGLSGAMAARDIKIINEAKERQIREERPKNLEELKNIIGVQGWEDISESGKILLKDLTKVYNYNAKAADKIAIKFFARELGLSEKQYRDYMRSEEANMSQLSKTLGTKNMSIKEIALSEQHKRFALDFLKNLPDISKMSPRMQEVVRNTLGWSQKPKRGAMLVTDANVSQTLTELGLQRSVPLNPKIPAEKKLIDKGQKTRIELTELGKELGTDILASMTLMYGKNFYSDKALTKKWTEGYGYTAWGQSLNQRVRTILDKGFSEKRTIQEIQNILKNENTNYRKTVQGNLGILKDSYKALIETGLDMKNPQEALQSMQNFLKIQTSFAGGLFKTMVPLRFLDINPQTGKILYTKKFENWHTEQMRELLNVNGRFLKDAKLLLEGKIGKREFNKRLNQAVKSLQQGLISARTAERKDSKGKTKMHYYDPILSIAFGGRKVWESTKSLDAKYGRSETLADVIMNTATDRVFKLIRQTPNSQLSPAGVIAKARIKNPKEFNSALKNNKQWNAVGDMMYSKDLTNGEYLSTLGNRDKALAEARRLNKKRKGISVFDFDDTLAKTKSKISVTMPDGKITRIDAAEFAKRHAELERMGATFDFSEFNKVIGGKKGPLFDLAVKRQGKFGTGDIFILTARPQASAPAIHAFLKGLGLDIPLKNIVGLENGSPIAKADWVMEKAGEGYNDFYFADDAIKNVKAVKKVLNVIDVKSKVQQAMASKDLNLEYNKIIEETYGVERFKDYSKVQARLRGAKHKESWWLPASASDLGLLLDRIAGRGKQGERHQQIFNETLYKPFARAEKSITEAQVNAYRDFKGLKKQFPEVIKRLKEKVNEYNIEHAIRVRNWTTLGMEIPGMSKRDVKMLNDKVNKDSSLSAFADQIIGIGKGEYAKPGRYWEVGGLLLDLQNTLRGPLRQQYLKEFNENVKNIFTPEMWNKLKAVEGPKYVEALQNILGRMQRGSNRTGKEGRIETRMLNFLNNATGAIMFLNSRTAILQTISSFNYLNWSDNNPFKASARFADIPQYVKDWNRLMNSDWAVARRKGLRINIQEAELAEQLGKTQDKSSAMLGYLLEKGFILTKIGDTFATATGGASFYRNRINTYKKQGFETKEAERKAYEDWIELSELNQQSARMDKISQQQASPLGRLVLAFANTPMQYARLQKRAFLDLKNNRGDRKTNISKIVYYAFVQNLMFTALQNALFTELYDEPGVSDDKTIRIINGMANTMLRGGGIVGAGVATLKDVGLKLYQESQKKRPKYSDAAWQLLSISPPVSAKVSKVRRGFAAPEYDMKEIKSEGFSLDNPSYLAAGNIVSGLTNVPLDRLIIKLQNIKQAMNQELQWYERMALLGGWKDWELGIEDGQSAKYFGDYLEEDSEILMDTAEDEEYKALIEKLSEKLP